MAEENLFYGENASSTAKCKDGEIMFTSAMLQRRVSKFPKVLDTVEFNMTDYDVEAVRTFFDVAMEFKQLDQDKSLIVLPLVMQYDVQDLLEKCVSYLTPTTMNENVIHTLNMAINVGCEELIDIALDFIKLHGVGNLFMQEQYYLLLEPKSVATILRFTYKNDASVLKSVVNWGRNYIEKHNIDLDLRTFFSKHLILKKLMSVDCLESSQSVLELYELDIKKNVFTEKEILKRLKDLSLKEGDTSLWVDINKGQTVVEKFTLKYKIMLCDTIIKFAVLFNPTICDFFRMKEGENNYFEITVQAFASYDCDNLSNTKLLSNSTSYKILPSETTGSIKSQITATVQKDKNYSDFKILSDVFINYRFHKDCKILKSKLQLQSPWQVKPPSIRFEARPTSFFTCGINFL